MEPTLAFNYMKIMNVDWQSTLDLTCECEQPKIYEQSAQVLNFLDFLFIMFTIEMSET